MMTIFQGRSVLAIGAAAALFMTVTGAQALTADPDGLWQGTVKCDGKFQGDMFSRMSLTIPVQLGIDGDMGVVENRFAGFGPDLKLYIGAYFPDSATKGTLGFATGPELPPYGLPFVEVGQAKLEQKKDGAVSLNGKSYVLADSPNGAVSALCEWKLGKVSDVAPPMP